MVTGTIDWAWLHETISTDRHAHLRQGKDVFMGWLVVTWRVLDGLRDDIARRAGG